MNDSHLSRIAHELHIADKQVAATAQLLAEGGTVPFIARYRKEVTGTLDEVAITSIRDRLAQLEELDKRREAIVKSLQERQLLSAELAGQIAGAETLTALEDLYQPYRPKKRTRAMIAKEKGLEPLAEWLLANQGAAEVPTQAARFITPAGSGVTEELRVPDGAAALAGARDIIAEKVSDDAAARAAVRELFMKQGLVTSKVISEKEPEEGTQKYQDYFNCSEPVATIPSHRLLAIRRGAAEGCLLFRIAPPEEQTLAALEALFVNAAGAAAEQVRTAVRDSYKRLLSLSMETEARLESRKKADTEAIRVFTQNMRELLLASPLGQKNVLAIDPGFRTGCKTVVLDRQGQLLYNDVIYPDQGANRTAEAQQTIKTLVEKYQIEAIAIGNGTGGRETEAFVRKLGLPTAVAVVMVNESGASIYSASEAAREEFPDHDLTVRGAVSIGRRLMDPLAELVKIDPKSIGVGQYQHDVDQEQLKQALDDTVTSCVNNVGVEVNTASKQLLTYVSGLNATSAENVVKYRNEHGPFKARRDLKQVPRLGAKTFEQAAGFLRIRGATGGPEGGHPLDASAVHPESYGIVEQMARDLGCGVGDLLRDEALRTRIDKLKYVTATVGLPTLTDILAELAKPGRDPRQQFEVFQFAAGLTKIEDVQVGMKLPGIVTNVTAFGAFVDIGVHQDGLVHISQLAERFIKDAADVVKVQQRVEVTVLEVDLPRKRISLTMRKTPVNGEAGPARPAAGQTPAGGHASQSAAPMARQAKGPAPANGEGWFSSALRAAKGSSRP